MMYQIKRFSSLLPTVLFLNGWGKERDFQERFIKNYPGKTITYDYMGRTNQALKDLRGIKSDIVVGFSFGGYLADKLDIPRKILVCPLLSFGKAHADFLGINYQPLVAKSGKGEATGIFGGMDKMVGKIDQDIFRKRYGEPIIIPDMKHKPSPEFWKELAKKI